MYLRINLLATLVILLAIPIIDGQSHLFAQDDASWKERFLTDAPPAWEKYRSRAKRLQGSIKRTTIRLSTKREVMNSDMCEIKQGDGCALFFVEDLGNGKSSDKEGSVMGINDRYGFEIRRPAPTAPWAVVNLDLDLSDGMSFRLGSPPSEGVVYWSTCPITFNLIPPFSWGCITDPGFTLKHVTSIIRKDRQAVKVEFDCPSRTDKPKFPSLKGWVLYDPQRMWVIHEYNAQFEWASLKTKASVVVTCDYEESAGGFPIPKRITRRLTPVGGVDRESQYEFDLKEADVPESDFTLSAFGLPEPPGVRRPRKYLFLWFAIAGTVCLSVASMWRRLRQRRSDAG